MLYTSSSPRTWGCFLRRMALQREDVVFPTHVGVFHDKRAFTALSSGLPHARGGVSSDAEEEKKA